MKCWLLGESIADGSIGRRQTDSTLRRESSESNAFVLSVLRFQPQFSMQCHHHHQKKRAWLEHHDFTHGCSMWRSSSFQSESLSFHCMAQPGAAPAYFWLIEMEPEICFWGVGYGPTRTR
eukprot:1249897-Rhodomonas_salina.3